jgi:peroxiredoxin
MSLTPSNMIPLGTRAPSFELPDGRGQRYGLEDVRGENGLLVVFMCNHCPYVKHLKTALVEAGNKLAAMGVGMVGINSNDVANYPDDAPEKMVEDAETYGYPFPYLYDETQEVAKAYDAACTPDFYLFDKDLKLVYRGQFDDSRPGSDAPVTGRDLYAAVEAMVGGEPVPADQTPSMGCNIKWK